MEQCVCSGQISSFRNIHPFDHKCIHIGVKYKIQDFALCKVIKRHAGLDHQASTKEQLQASFLETTPLLKAIMSKNAKSPLEGLSDSECKQGNIINWPPIPYVQPTDLNEKQEKTEIKVKFSDGTNYQMVPFLSWEQRRLHHPYHCNASSSWAEGEWERQV